MTCSAYMEKHSTICRLLETVSLTPHSSLPPFKGQMKDAANKSGK